MLLIFKIIFLLLFIYPKFIWASEECSFKNNLKVGLINNDFIDYQYYLYYEIGNYAQINNIDFELGTVDKNIDTFDIIFGEFNQLKNLTVREISLPNQIKEFYEDNGLEINQNILPLDLDTLIVLSNKNYPIKNLEELSNLYSPIKYTFGMNFNNYEHLSRLISFSSHQKIIKILSNTFESSLSSFNKLYINSNKNILDANFMELFISYENKENLFTLFSDGILLYKNLPNTYFRLFPQNNFIWNEDLGVFNNNSNSIPYSYYGFSALINNTNQFGLLCHLTKEDIRYNTFRNFNLQISPISKNELKNFETLPDGYEEIINLKKLNIIDNNTIEFRQSEIIRNIILGHKSYGDIIEGNNYLN